MAYGVLGVGAIGAAIVTGGVALPQGGPAGRARRT
jgi:hypothetical protein